MEIAQFFICTHKLTVTPHLFLAENGRPQGLGRFVYWRGCWYSQRTDSSCQQHWNYRKDSESTNQNLAVGRRHLRAIFREYLDRMSCSYERTSKKKMIQFIYKCYKYKVLYICKTLRNRQSNRCLKKSIYFNLVIYLKLLLL